MCHVGLLLSHPEKVFLQSWLAQVLGVDPRAVQRAATRLAALGFITVDTRFPAGKVIALSGDAERVSALQAFDKSLGEIQPDALPDRDAQTRA